MVGLALYTFVFWDHLDAGRRDVHAIVVPEVLAWGAEVKRGVELADGVSKLRRNFCEDEVLLALLALVQLVEVGLQAVCVHADPPLSVHSVEAGLARRPVVAGLLAVYWPADAQDRGLESVMVS